MRWRRWQLRCRSVLSSAVCCAGVLLAGCCSGARAAAADLLIRATSFGLGLELGLSASLEGREEGLAVRGSSSSSRVVVTRATTEFEFDSDSDVS